VNARNAQLNIFMKPNLNFYLCEQSEEPHRLAYLQWGDSDAARTLICVHGLVRNCHDFDALASRLADKYRIICPDVAGRGASDWLSQPKNYTYATYISDFLELLYSQALFPTYLGGILGYFGETQEHQIDWLGTSMGGLIGMSIAAMPNSPINRLILNDIGAFIPQAALSRIATYLRHTPTCFTDLTAAEQHFRQIYSNFGQLTDSQWQYLTYHSVRPLLDGGYQVHYDPKIAQVFNQTVKDTTLWQMWENIRCPVLILHGARSDVLTTEIVAEMCRIHPQTQIAEFADVGHAPPLLNDAQQSVVDAWLQSNP
jgi:pimeloyl-ACP methyl ester carboxylesterase